MPDLYPVLGFFTITLVIFLIQVSSILNNWKNTTFGVSIMCRSFLLLFTTFVIISVAALPSNLNDLSMGLDSSDVADNPNTQLNSATSDGVDCDVGSSSTDGFDKPVETFETDHNLNFVKRQKNFCPIQGIFRGGKHPLLEPSTNPSNPAKRTRKPDPGCTRAHPVLLSCGGPEVWYLGGLEYVLNCVRGKFFFLLKISSIYSQ